MSRNTTISTDGRYEVSWGKDHACGWFIQVFDLSLEDQDEPLVDKDQLFDGITAKDVITIAYEYNAGFAVQREMTGV